MLEVDAMTQWKLFHEDFPPNHVGFCEKNGYFSPYSDCSWKIWTVCLSPNPRQNPTRWYLFVNSSIWKCTCGYSVIIFGIMTSIYESMKRKRWTVGVKACTYNMLFRLLFFSVTLLLQFDCPSVVGRIHFLAISPLKDFYFFSSPSHLFPCWSTLPPQLTFLFFAPSRIHWWRKIPTFTVRGNWVHFILPGKQKEPNFFSFF